MYHLVRDWMESGHWGSLGSAIPRAFNSNCSGLFVRTLLHTSIGAPLESVNRARALWQEAG